MSAAIVTCPNCHVGFKLDESLAAPLLAATRVEYDRKLAEREKSFAGRDADLAKRTADLERRQTEIDVLVAEKLRAGRAALAAEEAAKAKLLVRDEIEAANARRKELEEVLKVRDAKLAEAQKAEAEFRKRERELGDKERELELTVERRLQEQLDAIRVKSRAEAEESFRLTLADKDHKMAGMAKTIDELKRKVEQGSQQSQGEVLELDMEGLLRARFPHDAIEAVAKGVSGADLVQRVFTPSGLPCGAILWETKRTKNWSDGWLGKLKNDQRAISADAALLVTAALPRDVKTFDLVDGVWVAELGCAVPVAAAIRQTLIAVAGAKRNADGQQTKAEQVYAYLTGPRFRHRVEAIVERFNALQDDLNGERKWMTRMWAKREAQIHGVLESTVGMYGDLQGVMGRELQEIESLETPLLEAKGDEAA